MTTSSANARPPNTGSTQPGIPRLVSASILTVNDAEEQAAGDRVHEHPGVEGLESERVQAVHRDRHGDDERDAAPTTCAGRRSRTAR